MQALQGLQWPIPENVWPDSAQKAKKFNEFLQLKKDK